MSEVTYLGTSAPAYASNPTQTAAAAADTVFKWGDGTMPVRHISIQNNTGANILYSFDVPTTGGQGAAVYVLASGLPPAVWDRHCLVLHLQSAAQQPINNGSTAGIVVEGFQ